MKSSRTSLRSRLKKIRLLLLDVDGVLTDGGVYYSDTGGEMKKFNIKDGHGIVKIQRSGIVVGIITGRVSSIVSRRAKDLGIQHVRQNMDDKASAYNELLLELGVTDSETAYIGDDEPDLQVLKKVGFSAAPADAVDVVRKSVTYVCKRNGGAGAVREVIDLILASRGDV